MSDITYKTTFTEAEILEKKNAYLMAQKTLVTYLREVAEMVELSGEAPLSGDNRKLLLTKFAMIDHRLLDKFDSASFAYFEATESSQS